MTRFLHEHGIPKSRIMLEKLAKSTTANAWYCMDMLSHKVKVNNPIPKKLYLVTSSYHMPWSAWIFKIMARAAKVKTNLIEEFSKLYSQDLWFADEYCVARD